MASEAHKTKIAEMSKEIIVALINNGTIQGTAKDKINEDFNKIFDNIIEKTRPDGPASPRATRG